MDRYGTQAATHVSALKDTTGMDTAASRAPEVKSGIGPFKNAHVQMVKTGTVSLVSLVLDVVSGTRP